jgi:hypothetical protein
MTTTVQITTTDTSVTLVSLYHHALPDKARAIGGRFDSATKAWHFDVRDEQRVRNLAREVYGTDGTPGQTVTVRLDISAFRNEGSVFLLGREIATRPSRDAPVRLGRGVIVVAGGFDWRGGSVKNPRLDPDDGTVLEIRDVPAEHSDLQRDDVQIIDQSIDVGALLAERERLLARVAEIDATIASQEGASPHDPHPQT